jgi:hypothetical protein
MFTMPSSCSEGWRETVAHYLVTYHMEGHVDPEVMAKARESFMVWAAKTGAALVDPGAPIGSTSTVTGDGFERDIRSDLPFNGWSVIEAADADAAAEILSDHPFVGRGGTLQINAPVEI